MQEKADAEWKVCTKMPVNDLQKEQQTHGTLDRQKQY